MSTGIAAAQFTGVDFYQVDTLLTEEERAVRDTVRVWVDDNLIPIIGDHYVQGKFPKQIIPGLVKLGVLGANLPEEYGCAGLGNVAYGLIMQELERGDSSIRSFASVQSGLVMYPILTYGSEEQRQHWLPKLAKAEEYKVKVLDEDGFLALLRERGASTEANAGQGAGAPRGR